MKDWKKGMMKKAFGLAAAAALALPLLVSAAPPAQEEAGGEPAQNHEQAVAGRADAPQNEGGDVSFLFPLALLGLGTLPVVWWLSRISPPQPETHDYPPVSLLRDLKSTEETPAKTPPWQLLLRLGAAGAFIFAMAQPVISLDEGLKSDGPLVLAVDNDWASASRWQSRRAEMMRWIDRAEREGRQVLILPTAPPPEGALSPEARLMDPAEARNLAEGLSPQPWNADRAAAGNALASFAIEGANVVWLSNGLNDAATQGFVDTLKNAGAFTVIEDAQGEEALLLSPSDPEENALRAEIRRPVPGDPENLSVTARADDGRVLERASAYLEKGDVHAKVAFNLPPEIRNQIVSLSIDGERSAGAVALLDEQWARRPVGIADASTNAGDPLLDETHYLRQALAPYADLRAGSAAQILEKDVAVLIMTDSAVLDEEGSARVDAWVRAGGTLLRFAGPHLANGDTRDTLFPVALRTGERETGGGAMSWAEPARLAAFSQKSPFRDIRLPDNVEIRRQVLAEADPSLAERAWASLTDGTPLVTGEKRGEGQIVLVHTSADPRWSNLPLSGVFVDMLRAVVAHSRGVMPEAGPINTTLAPWKTLDGFGKLGDPLPGAKALSSENAGKGIVGPENPPGFYGDQSVRKAHNIAVGIGALEPISSLPDGAERQTYAQRKDDNLAGAFLAGSMGLLIADLLLVLAQRGMIPAPRGENKKNKPGSNPAP